MGRIVWTCIVAGAALSGCDSGGAQATPDTAGGEDATAAFETDAPTDTATPRTNDGETPETSATVDAGPDAPGDVRDDVPDTVAPDITAACPAVGPYGTAVGAVLAGVTLVDTSGAPFDLASTCENAVTYINTFAGWCPPCRTVAEHAPDDYARFKGWGGASEWLFVVTEDAGGEHPTLAYCKAIAEDYALPMKVLCDVGGTFPAHLGVTSPNSWHVVLAEGQVVAFKQKYQHAAALDAAAALLGAH